MYDPSTIELEEGGDDLDRRARNGRAALRDHPSSDGNDPETTATDLISDVLTALHGPAGTHDGDGKLRENAEAYNAASELLRRALVSWEGDAEDYTRDDRLIVTEAQYEAILDSAVQRALTRDPRYYNAEDAEQQAEAEEVICNEEKAVIDTRWRVQ